MINIKNYSELTTENKVEALEKAYFEIQRMIARINGAVLIVVNETGEILIEKDRNNERKLMLPGGAIERGESPKHAACSETHEETKIYIDEEDIEILLGCFVQRIPKFPDGRGFLFLYVCKKYSGIPEPTDECEYSQFMSIKEIISRRSEFYLAAVRLIVHYWRYTQGFSSVPIEGRLSDQVDYVTDDGKVIVI